MHLSMHLLNLYIYIYIVNAGFSIIFVHYSEYGCVWVCLLLCLERGGPGMTLCPWTISTGGVRWFQIQPVVCALCSVYTNSASIWLPVPCCCQEYVTKRGGKSWEKEREKGRELKKGASLGCGDNTTQHICGDDSLGTSCGCLELIE